MEERVANIEQALGGLGFVALGFLVLIPLAVWLYNFSRRPML